MTGTSKDCKFDKVELEINGQTVEIVWTVSPALVLIILTLLSLRLLCLIDEVNEPFLTVKAVTITEARANIDILLLLDYLDLVLEDPAEPIRTELGWIV